MARDTTILEKEDTMTRQKREIMRKMEEIENFIRVDGELGCGFAPAGFYDELDEQIWNLGEELARLSHFDSYMDYLMDDRGLQACADEGLPWA
jgi:hypothetical protein